MLARKLFGIAGRGPSDVAPRQGCLTETSESRVVDADRHRGHWQVIAVIGGDVDSRRRERAVNLDVSPDGRVTFLERDAPLHGDTLRRVWPFRRHCRLVYVAPSGDECIVGTSDRSAAWILGRARAMDNERLFEHAAVLRGLGFDPKQLRLITRS